MGRTRLLAGLGVLAISFSAIFVRLAAVSPATAAFYRMLYALPLLLGLIGLLPARGRSPSHPRRWTLLAGVFFAADLILFHQSIAWIGAGLATLLASTQVLFVAVLGWGLHGERPRLRTLLVLPWVLGGVAAVSGWGDPAAYGTRPLAGTLAGASAGLSYALFLLTFRKARASAGIPLRAWLETTLVTGALCWAYGAGLERTFQLLPPPRSHLWLVLLAAVVQVAGWLLIARALPRLPALDTALTIVLQPVFTLVWGGVVFGETLSLRQGFGVTAVVGGLLLLVPSGSVRETGD